MLSYEQALNRILDGVLPLPREDTAMVQALGQALARDLHAPIALPPFDNSAMDGYAGRFEDLISGKPLLVVGESAAGRPWRASVAPGTLVRIATGALIPVGVDTVVPQEHCQVEQGLVHVTADDLQEGQFIRRAGEDVKVGDRVARKGGPIHTGLIGLLAALGFSTVPCSRRVRVGLIATGNELVAPGTPLLEGEIYNSNVVALEARLAEAGAVVAGTYHAVDTPDSLSAAFDAASTADVILTSGGVSVGDHDHVKDVLAERGHVDFWRVAIRPGKPFAFGRLGDTLFFGLPGNPVSTMVTFELFVRPVLMRLMGHESIQRPILRARLAERVEHSPDRRSFMRVQVVAGPDGYTARLSGGQGSAMLRSAAGANGLLAVPEDVDCLDEGTTVDVMMLDFISLGRP